MRHAFARQPEIQRYLVDVATRLGVRDRVRFGTALERAAWDAAAGVWRVATSRGAMTAEVLVTATGALSEPAVPDLPGLGTFAGPSFHSARWDHDVELDGRRVAEVPASVTDETFRRHGWHATGQCTFVLTAAEVPGLPDLPRLELYDADTNVLIYRRMPAAGQIPLRVMLINTGLEPETLLQAALFPHFQHSYFGIHKLPDEIMTCVLTGSAAPSAGRGPISR